MSKKGAAAKKVQGNLMYLGPTITGVVRHSTVFKGGVLPQKVNECVEQFPIMNKLFVVMEELPAAARELGKEQSALKAIYFQVAKKFNK